MEKKVNLYIIILLFTAFLYQNVSYSENLILPIKKPNLSKKSLEKKIIIGDIFPKKKPISKKKIVKKKEKKIISKNIEKSKKFGIIIPKNKPLVIKSQIVSKKKLKSKYFNKKDYRIANKSLEFMEKKQWKTALKTAKKAKEKSILNFIQWRHLLTKGNLASFYDYKSFIEENPNYPRISRIKYLSEHKINTKSISPDKIIKWFSLHPPLSGFGKMVLGESLVLIGNKKEGIKLIKDGWVSADLNKNSLRTYKKKYGKFLTNQDLIKRADYLAWENKYWDLKRMLKYLPKDHRALYNARQLLMSKSYGVDTAISKVPSKFKNDSGLNYDRLKWRRKRGRVESSLEILQKIKNTKEYMVRPDKWWKERSIIGRSLIYQKKYTAAYKIVSKHGLSNGPNYAEAEWMSGWIALSFLNDPLIAIDHFKNFHSNVGYPISLSRGAYWLAKSYEKIGNDEKANKWYREASKFLTTYYGQLAFLKISPNEYFSLNQEQIIEKNYRKKFFEKDLVKIVYLLNELNKDKYTKHILRHLANDNVNAGSEILAAELATNISRYDFAIQISKIASYQKRFHNNYNYPIISIPLKVNNRKVPDPAIILSIIRQESEFDMKAYSSAGARGMMQLMTYTAKTVAKRAKLPYSKSRLTRDPEYNINLGSYYFSGLLLEYDGAYPFAIAAYNAGPKRVKYWKKINKNPQKNQIDYVDWIELIKFKETRNYVQRVLENYNVYRYILEKKPIKMKNFFKNQVLY